MAWNPWVHGTRRRRRPAREVEVCGVGSMRRPHGAQQGEAGSAQRAQTQRSMRTEMAQVRGGDRGSGMVMQSERCWRDCGC
jgi:hypothetical protein